jgi:hypothetical protein
MPEPKDTIIAILGASGALAGLLLVFTGFIFAQAASEVTGSFARAAKIALYPCGALASPRHVLNPGFAKPKRGT